MINSRQFVIAKKRCCKPEYHYLELHNGYIFSYHKDLKFYVDKDREMLLLGFAWQVDKERKSPKEELEKLYEIYNGKIPEEEIYKMEDTWCGRYILIVRGKVYLDASGLLGVFYSKTGISSSCLLLAESMGLSECLYEASEKLNWLPGPLTQYKDIRRLLPSQVYDLYSDSIQGRRLLSEKRINFKNEKERIDTFISYFSFSLKNMANLFPEKKILIALTGGYDSRTLLALAKYSGIEFECFTLEHDNITKGDIELPQELCQAIKCGYLYLQRNKDNYSAEEEKNYIRHSSGLANDGDKWHYVYGQYQELVRRFGDIVCLRSSIWETAIEYFRNTIGDEMDVKNVCANFNAHGLQKDSIEEYSRWVVKNEQKDLSLCNRFLWEQRYGSWLSSIEQSFDLMDHIVSLQPLNCRFLIEMLLGFSREDRIIKKHQVKIISEACPELEKIRFNNDKNDGKSRFLMWKQRIEKGLHRLETLGLKKTIRVYLKIINYKIEEKRLKNNKIDK